MAVALVVAACSADTLDDATDETAPATTEPTGATLDDAAPPAISDSSSTSDVAAESAPDDDRGADYLFDPNLLHTFEFALTDDDLRFLDDDPTAEEYVPATMTFEGDSYEVGLRYKGSVGAFFGCTDGPNPFQPSGAKTCQKLSMKVKINWNDSKDEFLGVRKLQLHAMNLDPSQMRERVGYHLLREMGVAAPRSTHARVVINGEFVGLFALVENIDGRFTRANFDDGTGNLYKEAWPFTADGAITDTTTFLQSLRTNEDDETSPQLIQRFARDLLDADDPAEVVRAYMDVDALMAQLAVDRTIRHDDGPFHWYCDGLISDQCGPHNFFFYEDPTNATITMIPWDLDNAFANIITEANPVIPIPDGLGDITADCEAFSYGPLGIAQRSASCDPLFAAWASMEPEYLAAIERLHDGPLRDAELDPLIDRWTEQIGEPTAQAAETHEDALRPEAWGRALDELRAQLEHARANPIGG